MAKEIYYIIQYYGYIILSFLLDLEKNIQLYFNSISLAKSCKIFSSVYKYSTKKKKKTT